MIKLMVSMNRRIFAESAAQASSACVPCLTVTELTTMPYGMRLARGFTILSGNKRDL